MCTDWLAWIWCAHICCQLKSQTPANCRCAPPLSRYLFLEIQFLAAKLKHSSWGTFNVLPPRHRIVRVYPLQCYLHQSSYYMYTHHVVHSRSSYRYTWGRGADMRMSLRHKDHKKAASEIERPTGKQCTIVALILRDDMVANCWGPDNTCCSSATSLVGMWKCASNYKSTSNT